MIESWSSAKRDVLRAFLLQEVVVKAKALSADQLQVMLALPIWQRCEGLGNAPSYCDLGRLDDSGKILMKIPPKLAEYYTLTQNHIYMKDDSERPLYLKMGLEEVKLGELFSGSVVQQIKLGQLYSKIDELSVFILNNISTIERESGPDSLSVLGQTAFVRVASGKRLPPKDLYDPAVHEFRLLLSPNLFPSPEVYNNANIATLRRLGLNTSFSSAAIIKAASAIEAAVNHYLSQDPPDEAYIRGIYYIAIIILSPTRIQLYEIFFAFRHTTTRERITKIPRYKYFVSDD